MRADGRADEAWRAYREAVRRNPDVELNDDDLNVVLRKLEKPDEALAVFREAVRLEPASTNARYNLGKALLAVRKYAEAVDVFRAAVELEPSQPKLLDMLARSLWGIEDYAGAEPVWRDLRGRHPRAFDIAFHLALNLDRLGKSAEAVVSYLDALRLMRADPADPSARPFVGTLTPAAILEQASKAVLSRAAELEAKGEESAAIVLLEELAKLVPDDRKIQSRLAALKE